MYYDMNKLRPFSIGLDSFFNFADSFWPESVNVKFPPYNINKVETGFIIEFALAGYKKEEIQITLQDNTLKIEGNKKEQSKESNSLALHKGISNRSFIKSFALGDNIIVKDATMIDGMLTIVLEQFIPEEKKPKNISIN